MSSVPTTLFDLPNAPQSIGAILPPADLRRLDFSALDYDTARRVLIEYVYTYYPDQFNDFTNANGFVMLMDIIAAITDKLALRSDIQNNDAFLPLALSEDAVVNHLALINQRIKRQTPALVDVEVTVDQPVFSDLMIPAATAFSVVNGPSGSPIIYEIFRAPGDFTGNITIPAGKRGTVAFGIEGQFASPVQVTSAGGPNQQFTVTDVNILDSPIFVTGSVAGVESEWQVVQEPIERFGPTDKVVEITFIGSNMIFRFGDDVTGAAPLAGQTLNFRYRVGGGIRGRIGVGVIDTTLAFTPQPPANASTQVRFRNITPSNGGTDKETLDQAKRRAPRDFAVQRSIVTPLDYAQVASTFAHPAFGSVLKAIATIRTGYNANLVEIYALAVGADGLPTAPNAGLKAGLETYVSDLNVLTDHVNVLDGLLHPVDVDATVVIDRNSDASVIKGQVETALTNFFDQVNWELGQGLYVSKIIKVIEGIDGVAHVDLFAPSNNILPTGQLAGALSPTGQPLVGVALNELIVEGRRTVRYYYDKILRQ